MGCDLDTSTLPGGEAGRLCALIDAARLRQIKAQPPTQLMPDTFHYQLTVEDTQGTVDISFDDPVACNELEDLIAFLRHYSKAQPLD